jgi:predicted MFS family arabinose efflux permease
MIQGLFLLAYLTWNTEIFVLIVGINFGAALRVAPLQALLTELVGPEETASYIAARNIASQLGIGFAVLFGSQIYAQYQMVGVSLFCGLLTLGAWITIKAIDEPNEFRKQILPNAVYD